jgi:hypothetical protein
MMEAGILGFGGWVTVLRDSPHATVTALDVKGQQAHLKTPAMVGVLMPGGSVHGLHGWEAMGWAVLDCIEDSIRSPHGVDYLLHRGSNTLIKQITRLEPETGTIVGPTINPR